MASSQNPLTFQELILRLQTFWAENGCVLQQPYDVEVGAGTMAPETFLRVLGPKPYRVGYVQPSRRPADGRYGENPNRLFKHMQYQVILKPPPDNVQDLYLDSLRAIGIDLRKHDIKFEEDNWESPTLGAWGIGWQVMLDGLEITQFTYFQQCGGIDLDPISAELTYGLERIAAFLQDVDSIYDITWVIGAGWPSGEVRRDSPAGRAAVFGVQLRARRRGESLEAPASCTNPNARRCWMNTRLATAKLEESDADSARRRANSEERIANSEERTAKTLSGAGGLRPLPEVLAPVQHSRCAWSDQRDRARGRDRAHPGAGGGSGQGVRGPAAGGGRSATAPEEHERRSGTVGGEPHQNQQLATSS